MNVEITAYVDVPGDDEAFEREVKRIADRFADVLGGRYSVEDARVRAIVVSKILPKAWAVQDEVGMVERMMKRAFAVCVPVKTDPKLKEKTT